MFPSEVAFLAFGLVLGAAVGGALAQALRGRPAPRREVRLTITPNALPVGRTRTVAILGGSAYPGVVPGSPDGEAMADGARAIIAATTVLAAADTSGGAHGRTRVPSAGVVLAASAVGVPVGEARSPAPMAAPVPTAAPSPAAAPAAAVPGPEPNASRPSATAVAERLERVAAPIVAGIAMVDLPPVHDPRPSNDPPPTLVRPRPPAEPPRPSLPAMAVAVTGLGAASPATTTRVPLPQVRLAPPSGPTLTRPPASPSPSAVAAGTTVRASGQEGGAPLPAGGGAPGAITGGDPGAAAGAQPEASGPCAGPRRLVDERCALAGVARDQARAAADSLREAQRAYDILRERVDRAAATAEPRRVAAEKDRLHAAFRDASDRAGSSDETEAAARAWLDDLNALNAAVREGVRIVENGGAELRGALPALERRSAEADAARIAAENAAAGCHEAREDLAACEEAETRARIVPQPEPEEPHPFDEAWPSSDSPGLAEPAAANLLTGQPAIVRILRGDREARERLVAELSADDAASRSDWQLRISRLVDAITGRAIEDGYLDLPDDDPFWRLFELRESRDIVGALSALGFRYDGMGGFADGRVPAARDLSLAVGYAGLDRMRIRTWPRDSDLGALYARATVASDQWLAEQAFDLSLGRMVDALGARAGELADVWNAWGRVRPALLAE